MFLKVHVSDCTYVGGESGGSGCSRGGGYTNAISSPRSPRTSRWFDVIIYVMALEERDSPHRIQRSPAPQVNCLIVNPTPPRHTLAADPGEDTRYYQYV